MTVSGDTPGDGTGDTRLFSIPNGVTVTLNNLNLETGRAYQAQGGAIENYGVLTVANSTLSGNSSNWGGAIYSSGGMLSGVVSTESVGPTTLTFTATDLAGNSASLDCTCHVICDFGGFYPPVEPAPGLNEAKAGSSVPLKFSLGGDRGLEVIVAGYPASQPVDCETLEPIGSLEPAEPPGRSGLSYAAGNGWYTTVWKTDKAWAGGCRTLVIQLVDGTEHPAHFQFQ